MSFEVVFRVIRMHKVNKETLIDQIENEVEQGKGCPEYQDRLQLILDVQLILNVSDQPVDADEATDLSPTQHDEADIVDHIHGAVGVNEVKGSWSKGCPARDGLIDWYDSVDPGENKGGNGQNAEWDQKVHYQL